MSLPLDKQLLILKDPSHPLLKKMRQKAPGTYFHSLLVGEVASFASFNFNNANPLLALVGGLFHDIGKMINPFAYAENQEDGEYPFMPEIIRTHVKEGLQMAEAFQLPKEIIRFIITHHGTSNAPCEPGQTPAAYEISEKPVTVEETLVMLADSCEAAVRGYRGEYTKDNIQEIVRNVFLQKEKQDQLGSSVLISADFKQVEDDFIDSFYFVYHRRYATEKSKI